MDRRWFDPSGVPAPWKFWSPSESMEFGGMIFGALIVLVPAGIFIGLTVN